MAAEIKLQGQADAPAQTTCRTPCRWERDDWFAGGLLVAAVLLTFGPVLECGFINYGDPAFVSGDDKLRAGLTWEGLSWACTDAYFDMLRAPPDDVSSAPWQPLVWWTFLLDYQLYGPNTWGYHLTNLLWHLASTLLLFAALRRLSSRTWASFGAAALFAVHPLNVQSVAFVAARQGLVSGFFWMLTLLAYARYVEKPSRRRYILVALSLALGLQAGQILLTLPCVLLLLDFWPLRRWPSATLGSLLLEKLPLFALALGATLLVLLAHWCWASPASYEPLPLAARLGNAMTSYVAYLTQALLPSNLALHYPYPVAGVAPGQSLAAALLLAALTVVALRQAPRWPYVTVGWLWFLGTLLPVSGVLLQLGRSARADRYTYIPLVGIDIAASWALVALVRRGRHVVAGVSAGVLLLGYMVVSRHAVEPWRNSLQAWQQALRVTEPDAVTHHYLACALLETDRQRARKHFEAALRLDPAFPPTLQTFVPVLVDKGELEAAAEYCRAALEIRPGLAAAHRGLGLVALKHKDLGQAVTHLRTALWFNPRDVSAHLNLGLALLEQGAGAEARRHFEAALARAPNNVDALYHLGLICLRSGERDGAAEHFRAVLRLKPNDELAHLNLGIILKDEQDPAAALQHLQTALDLVPDLAAAHYHLGLLQLSRGELKQADSHLQAAVRLLPTAAPALVSLGKLRLRQGDGPAASRCFEKAAALDPENAELRVLLKKTAPEQAH